MHNRPAQPSSRAHVGRHAQKHCTRCPSEELPCGPQPPTCASVSRCLIVPAPTAATLRRSDNSGSGPRRSRLLPSRPEDRALCSDHRQGLASSRGSTDATTLMDPGAGRQRIGTCRSRHEALIFRTDRTGSSQMTPAGGRWGRQAVGGPACSSPLASAYRGKETAGRWQADVEARAGGR